MATVVQLHQVEVGSKGLHSHLWKVEYDQCEGMGTTPERALEAFRECHSLFTPNDREKYVLPRRSSSVVNSNFNSPKTAGVQ